METDVSQEAEKDEKKLSEANGTSDESVSENGDGWMIRRKRAKRKQTETAQMSVRMAETPRNWKESFRPMKCPA